VSAVAGDPLAARRYAIEHSGWGQDFDFVQPHNLAFWVYCLLVVSGATVLWGQVRFAAAAYPAALVSGLVVFGLLAVVYLWFIHHEDRYATVPGKLAVAAFVYGAVAAIGAFALYGNGAVTALYAKVFGADFAFDWSAALTAPIDEELAKGSGIVLLLLLAPRLIRSPFDGLIVGAFLGLGFQIVEDISYASLSAASDFGEPGATADTLLVRTLSSVSSHWMFSAIFCAGVIWFVGRPDAPARRGLGLGLMATAMLLHGTWDAIAPIAGGSALGYVLPIGVTAVGVAVVVWIYRTTVPIERTWMREIMAPEVEIGIIDKAELDALAGGRRTRNAYVRAAAGERSARHVLTAASDLAHQLARDGGAATPAVDRARNEVTRLRAVNAG
jgi:RsiW-degrading membrane proteinase PrsW (M82 family)